MTNLPTQCDLGYPATALCGWPVTYYALSAETPDMWGSGTASLGGYCCLQHANTEPRPTLADARRVYELVLEERRCGWFVAPEVIATWQHLLDAYPNPIPATSPVLAVT
jgi:hypothetical protein